MAQKSRRTPGFVARRKAADDWVIMPAWDQHQTISDPTMSQAAKWSLLG